MILDKTLEFADAESVGTPNNSTVNVGGFFDGGGDDIGTGTPLYLVVQVDTAITSGGSAIVNFQVVSDATTTIAVDDTQTIHFRSDDIAIASLTAGQELIFMLPYGTDLRSYERYIGFQIRETAGQALTGGAVNAFITSQPRNWKAHADASN